MNIVNFIAFRGGRRQCGRAAQFDAVVGREADLQCSVGAVNRVALYLWLWKLPMRSTLFMYTLRNATKKFENM